MIRRISSPSVALVLLFCLVISSAVAQPVDLKVHPAPDFGEDAVWLDQGAPVPPGVRHSVKALTDGRAIIVDYPLRPDFR